MLIVVPAAWGTIAAIGFGGAAAYRGWVDWRIAMDERRRAAERLKALVAAGRVAKPAKRQWDLCVVGTVVVILAGVCVSITGAMHTANLGG